jgi:hypothetical protein
MFKKPRLHPWCRCLSTLRLAHYNFVRPHSSLRVTSPMSAGVADGVWDVSDTAA